MSKVPLDIQVISAPKQKRRLSQCVSEFELTLAEFSDRSIEDPNDSSLPPSIPGSRRASQTLCRRSTVRRGSIRIMTRSWPGGRRTSLTADEVSLLRALDGGIGSLPGSRRGSCHNFILKSQRTELCRSSASQKLRTSMNECGLSLPSAERRYLSELLDSDATSAEMLEKAALVLDNDAHYKKSHSIDGTDVKKYGGNGAASHSDTNVETDVNRRRELHRTISGAKSSMRSEIWRHTSMTAPEEALLKKIQKNFGVIDIPQGYNAPAVGVGGDHVARCGSSIKVLKGDEDDESLDSTAIFNAVDKSNASFGVAPHVHSPAALEVQHAPGSKRASYRAELWKTKQCSLSEVDEENQDNEEKKTDLIVDSMDSFEFVETNHSSGCSFGSELWQMLGEMSGHGASLYLEDHHEGEIDGKEEKLNIISFLIMGTSAEDTLAHPHVLTPPLMDTLRSRLPFALQEDNFWLKYSLMKDGASMKTLLDKVHSSSHTILAIETFDGEVFGSFTSNPWQKRGKNYYGSCEAFLWRMQMSRRTPCDSMLERAMLESEVDIFRWSGKNRNIQLVDGERLIVGGGEADDMIESKISDGDQGGVVKQSSGVDFGLKLNSDLSSGTSGKCVTFNSPSLSRLEESFEISNVEVWTLTPMAEINQAEKLEFSRHFVPSNMS